MQYLLLSHTGNTYNGILVFGQSIIGMDSNVIPNRLGTDSGGFTGSNNPDPTAAATTENIKRSFKKKYPTYKVQCQCFALRFTNEIDLFNTHTRVPNVQLTKAFMNILHFAKKFGPAFAPENSCTYAYFYTRGILLNRTIIVMCKR